MSVPIPGEKENISTGLVEQEAHVRGKEKAQSLDRLPDRRRDFKRNPGGKRSVRI